MARLLRKLSCTNRGQQDMGKGRRIPKMKIYGEIYSSICNKFFDVMDSVIDDPLSAEELTKISSESHK
jgi:hypothetical protein